MKKALGRGPFFAAFFLVCLAASQAALSAGGRGKRGDFDIAAGDLKATLHRETGTFMLYKLRETGKNRYDPLLDTRNYGAGTCFSVSVNGRTYVLEKKAFKDVGFEASDGGREASFLFAQSDDFHVEQRFYMAESAAFGRPSFALAIETSVENTSAGPISVAWRAVIDTALGESRSSSPRGHLVADNGQAFGYETLAVPSDSPPRFLFSSNGERTCAISLEGADTVYIANWNRCNALLRAPFSRSVDCVEGRSLSSAYATDDSAVLMCWPEVALNRGESASVTVYLSAVDPQPAAAPSAAREGRISRPPAESDPSADAADAEDEDSLFREKQELYYRVVGRIRQLESGEAPPIQSEIDDLNRILDFLLDDSE